MDYKSSAIASQVQILSSPTKELGARLYNEQANLVANQKTTMVVNTAQDLIRSGGRSPSVENEIY